MDQLLGDAAEDPPFEASEAVGRRQDEIVLIRVVDDPGRGVASLKFEGRLHSLLPQRITDTGDPMVQRIERFRIPAALRSGSVGIHVEKDQLRLEQMREPDAPLEDGLSTLGPVHGNDDPSDVALPGRGKLTPNGKDGNRARPKHLFRHAADRPALHL